MIEPSCFSETWPETYARLPTITTGLYTPPGLGGGGSSIFSSTSLASALMALLRRESCRERPLWRSAMMSRASEYSDRPAAKKPPQPCGCNSTADHAELRGYYPRIQRHPR